MGTFNHHSIVITSWNEETIHKAHTICKNIVSENFNELREVKLVSEVVGSAANGYCSFFIAPDGSKEGWETSQEGDTMRNEICEALYELGVDFVEVQFSPDYNNSSVVRDSYNYDQSW